MYFRIDTQNASFDAENGIYKIPFVSDLELDRQWVVHAREEIRIYNENTKLEDTSSASIPDRDSKFEAYLHFAYIPNDKMQEWLNKQKEIFNQAVCRSTENLIQRIKNRKEEEKQIEERRLISESVLQHIRSLQG